MNADINATTHVNVGAIGVFDGVHRGHRALLAQARSMGGHLVAVTFDPHPRQVVAGTAPTSLATVPQRVALLREAGADDVVVLDFTPELAAMSAHEFVTSILVGRLALDAVVVGENFRFGAQAHGDVALMAQIGEPLGLRVTSVPMVGDGIQRWSSSRIRALIEAGEIDAANAGLDRPYRVTGTVEHGAGRGRTLGYPTANLALIANPTIPADGVYAGYLDAGEGAWPAAISIGTNPQFGSDLRTVEAYVLDRAEDLYGRVVELAFVGRLRGQRTFDDVGGLVAQMAMDVAQVRDILSA